MIQLPTQITSMLGAGRFDEDVAAAKAYDKAAVFLYGSNAITNFGLEACQVDPTEVGQPSQLQLCSCSSFAFTQMEEISCRLGSLLPSTPVFIYVLLKYLAYRHSRCVCCD